MHTCCLRDAVLSGTVTSGTARPEDVTTGTAVWSQSSCFLLFPRTYKMQSAMDQIISQRSPKLCLSSLRVGFTNEDIGYDIFATYTFSQKKTVNTSAMSEKNADHSPGKHCLLNPFILPTVLGLFWFSGTEGEMQRSTRHVFGPRCVPGPGGTSAQPHLGQPSPLLGELHLLYGSEAAHREEEPSTHQKLGVIQHPHLFGLLATHSLRQRWQRLP